jgi:hypothetical protein
MAIGKHEALPKKVDYSELEKISKHHQDNCLNWTHNKFPWQCAAHHILPLTCINSIECTPASKAKYIRRCLWVSKWNINGGPKYARPKGGNNMVKLPTISAYRRRYKSTLAKFVVPHPVNLCSHSGTEGEHYLYIKEVHVYLEREIWSKVQEDKVNHKLKAEDVNGELGTGEDHFRGELVRRGNRPPGTINGWLDQTKPMWSLPFSMADDFAPGNEEFCTQLNQP